jgi:FAD/FMN-containing dehydrogenase/ferredoxin
MVSLSPAQRAAIVQIVGPERARFDRRERRVYSHDIGTLPRPVRLLDRATLADAVVQPETEEELICLVRFAATDGIPLVPRGKGTSGYGGAVPTRGGIVLDMTRLRGIVRVEPSAPSVTVRAGTVWQPLESQLGEYGLALRMYPSSAPASTVGGWLAQGGAGFGSHAYGWFSENVLSARIVTADSAVRELPGDAVLDVASAEGTTGVITEVTLAARPFVPEARTALFLPSAEALALALRLLAERDVPLWSVSFVDPTLARFKNSYQAEPSLPEHGYTLLCVYESQHTAAVLEPVREVLREAEGGVLLDEVAEHEWQARYKPMRIKRLGPSLIPFEVVVPVNGLAAVLDDLKHAATAPTAIEGLSVRGQEVVLVGMIPHDERRLTFTAGYAAALSAVRAAERHGGRAYGTGRYFGGRSASVLGAATVDRIASAKTHNDPHDILNPGKVSATNALSRTIDLACAVEPVMRRIAGPIGSPPEPRPVPEQDFRAEVASYAYACAQCGYCVDVCPQYQDSGCWETTGPRGKWSFLKEVFEKRDHFDNAMMDTFAMCVGCRKCDEVCQLDLPIESTWSRLRSTMMRGVLTRTS